MYGQLHKFCGGATGFGARCVVMVTSISGISIFQVFVMGMFLRFYTTAAQVRTHVQGTK